MFDPCYEFFESWYENLTDEEIKKCNGDYIGCEICRNKTRCAKLWSERFQDTVNQIHSEKEKSKMNSVYIIYQLPASNPNIFREYDKQKFNLKDYVRVWGDEWNDEKEIYEQLEEIYERFNLEQPEHFVGRSLSVSDVIEVIDGETNESKYFYCADFGFSEISK